MAQPSDQQQAAQSDYQQQVAAEQEQAGQQQEGWQFWPPAGEQGGPVWPQATGNGQAGDQGDEGSEGRHSGASDEGAYQRPN